METFVFGQNGLPINDAVPAPTRIMPGNEFLWNWQAMQEYALTAIKAVSADADAAEEVLGVAAAEQCIRAETAELNASRYKWLRRRLAGSDHVAELCEYSDGERLAVEVDEAIDAAMNGANTQVQPRREAASAATRC